MTDSILFGKLPHCDQLMEKTWIEDKNKSAQWTELHAVILSVMEELDNKKGPEVCVDSDSWVVVNGLVIWSSSGQQKTGLLR